MSTPRDALSAGLGYARRGWFVLPIAPRGKQPLTSHGHKDATTDPRTIKAWFKRWPDAGIAVALQRSGLAVIDVDGPDGRDELARLERTFGVLPPTHESTSGRPHRKHYWFINANGLTGRHTRINDVALDVLADGYVIVAPSLHEDLGTPYRWLRTSPLAPLPGWVARVSGERNGRGSRTPAGPLPDVLPVGQRDELLTSLAGSMRRRGATHDAILAALREQNATCEEPLDDRQLAKIARSIAQKPTLPLNFHDPINDANLARHFATLERAELRYCKQWRKWLIWDGARWAPDDTFEAERRVETMVRAAFGQLDQVSDPDAREVIFRTLNKYMQRRKLEDVLAVASHHADLVVTPDRLDGDPELLNVRNGTLDLRTGKLLPHAPTDLITKLAPITYDPKARAPRWARFVSEIMPDKDNAAEVAHLQRAVGYTLTGLVREHVLFFCFGGGSNGKTTLLETLYALFGDYATTIDFETLLHKRYQSSAAQSRDLPRLHKARFVQASETPLHARWDEGTVKRLTGGDTLSGRWLYREMFDFTPTHTLWCRGNHRPSTRDPSPGFWRRMRLLPFTREFRGRAQQLDLKDELLRELPGILNWALAGCRRWYADGLGAPPKRVLDETARYQKEQHPLASFIAARCVKAKAIWTPSHALHGAFAIWWREVYGPRVPAPSMAEFSQQLRTVSGLQRKKRKRAGEKVWGWYGLGLKGGT